MAERLGDVADLAPCGGPGRPDAGEAHHPVSGVGRPPAPLSAPSRRMRSRNLPSETWTRPAARRRQPASTVAAAVAGWGHVRLPSRGPGLPVAPQRRARPVARPGGSRPTAAAPRWGRAAPGRPGSSAGRRPVDDRDERYRDDRAEDAAVHGAQGDRETDRQRAQVPRRSGAITSRCSTCASTWLSARMHGGGSRPSPRHGCASATRRRRARRDDAGVRAHRVGPPRPTVTRAVPPISRHLPWATCLRKRNDSGV